jgi:hypothetical protein|tara:strand:+ start:1039 stop:1659 length:621 start_codon:yes stop_codon:yes gene_type:complete
MPSPTPEHFDIASIKDDFLHLAQTSVYMVDCTSAVSTKPFYRPSGMDSNEQRKCILLCSEATIPGSGSATHESTGDFAGVTEKMVYRRIFDESLDLTFYVDAKYVIPEFLESWHSYCLGEDQFGEFDRNSRLTDGAYYRMNYPSEYKGDIFLTKFEKDDKTNQPKMSYRFKDAFPQSIASIPISYNASEILKITASFSYTRYIKED